MDLDDVWRTIDSERTSLADVIDDLSPAEWETPSLCAGWRVRDVAAHPTPAHPGAGGATAAARPPARGPPPAGPRRRGAPAPGAPGRVGRDRGRRPGAGQLRPDDP